MTWASSPRHHGGCMVSARHSSARRGRQSGTSLSPAPRPHPCSGDPAVALQSDGAQGSPLFRCESSSPRITQRAAMSATLRSSPSAAQWSCCGPAAQAADEPLGDSLPCHFLCVAPRLVAGRSGWLQAGAETRRPLASVAAPGRGQLWPPPASFHVGRGLPARRANPRRDSRRQPASGAGRREVCSRASARLPAPAWRRHVFPIRPSSAPGPLNGPIFMKK